MPWVLATVSITAIVELHQNPLLVGLFGAALLACVAGMAGLVQCSCMQGIGCDVEVEPFVEEASRQAE